MKKFYDTCALLKLMDKIFEEDDFVISSITLKELENIKTSINKDFSIKYQARCLIHLLDTNFNRYETINYNSNWNELLKQFLFLSDNNDSKIILSAYYYNNNIDNIIFVTEDLCCKQLAKILGLQTEYLSAQKQDLLLDKSNFIL